MVTVFAPVNIAWVKYMGKSPDGPANDSFSMTLEGLGSRTRIERVGDSPGFTIDFEGSPYVPPESGQRKIHSFLSEFELFSTLLRDCGFSCTRPIGRYRILTSNNVPAGTGIATSASGFAALTLAWLHELSGDRGPEWISRYGSDSRLPERAARIARIGSGSACRSFHGPFVEWTTRNEILPFSVAKDEFVDFILLLEDAPKEVPSSDAHRRVQGSPLLPSRVGATARRLAKIKEALLSSNHPVLAQEVRTEALEMHELFHSSMPPFSYLNQQSRFWLSGSWRSGTSFENAILTADAGANVHVFLPASSSHEFEVFLKRQFPELRFLVARSGKGAVYASEGF